VGLVGVGDSRRTSENISGPYTKVNVAVQKECHNPQVVYDASVGKYLLFHIGGSSWLSISSFPSGPFKAANTSKIPHCNNPAPAYHPNGTLFVVCNQFYLTNLIGQASDGALERGDWTPLRPSGVDPGSCNDTARHWEDAHLWFDKHENWHIIYHVYCLEPYSAHHECFSGHAFSADGLAWTVSDRTLWWDCGIH
jgi:hypothetical protein